MTNKIGRVYQNKVAMDEFFSLLNDFKSIPEFENRWTVWITSNVLDGNKWLAKIYKIQFN